MRFQSWQEAIRLTTSSINGGFEKLSNPLESYLALSTTNHKNIKALWPVILPLGIYLKEIIQTIRKTGCSQLLTAVSIMMKDWKQFEC